MSIDQRLEENGRDVSFDRASDLERDTDNVLEAYNIELDDVRDPIEQTHGVCPADD
jgi:hypothetical protein